jgi:hypothetical protein
LSSSASLGFRIEAIQRPGKQTSNFQRMRDPAEIRNEFSAYIGGSTCSKTVEEFD